MSNTKRGPVLIDLDDAKAAQPDTAPAVPEAVRGPAAMQHVASIAARKPSRLARFWP